MPINPKSPVITPDTDGFNIDLALGEVKNLKLERKSLQNQYTLGIINKADIMIYDDMISRKEYNLKKRLVDGVHLTSKNKPRSISFYDKPYGSYTDGHWYSRVEGNKMFRSATKEGLYYKLFDFYFGELEAFTVSDIFEKALAEKKDTENPKDGTIRRYRFEFERYFTDEFQKRDIQKITDTELKTYTQNLVNTQSMTDKRFLSYKGILNLIFGYAHMNGIITANPVIKIRNQVYLKSCDCVKADSDEKILTPEEIQMLIDTTQIRADKKYYVYHYAMKFSSLTGTRIGELCSLKWTDINFDAEEIHIHTQQLTNMVNGHYEYYEVPYTKNERGISKGGRIFPLTDDLIFLLNELIEVQNKEDIHSEYVFCHEDGRWINTKEYDSFFRKLCNKCGLNVCNNHALRMSLNSNVLIPMGISVTDRAKLLGHSVETNLRNYSFARKDYIDNAREILNSAYNSDKVTVCNTCNTIPFRQQKSPQTANL